MLPSALLVAAMTVLPMANPPEAAFALNRGRLVVRVTHAGRPLGGVIVRCLVGRDLWATADTDADGRASLARPPKDWCQVVCDIGDGPTAPIPLTFLTADEVVPQSFPVRNGAADCCLAPLPPPRLREPQPASASVIDRVIGLGFGSIVAGLLFAFIRHRSSRPINGRPKPNLNTRRKRR